MKKAVLLLLGLSLAMLSAFASATATVQLLKVQSIVDAGYQTPTFDVLVANLGYQKQVYIHQQLWDGSWSDFPLSYSRPASNGEEVWTGIYVPPLVSGAYPTWDLHFAVKYVVNGQTYWDNNGGANYNIARDSGTTLGGATVYNGNYTPTAFISILTTYPGWVTVANLAYAKQVTVVYSTDNWATTQTTAASYSPSFWSSYGSNAANPNQYGFEDWAFSLNVGNAASVSYAISYTVNGQTYWDNNFGQNYTVTLTHGR